jgi:hypothetical protein
MSLLLGVCGAEERQENFTKFGILSFQLMDANIPMDIIVTIISTITKDLAVHAVGKLVMKLHIESNL